MLPYPPFRYMASLAGGALMGPSLSLIRRRPIVSFIRFYSANFYATEFSSRLSKSLPYITARVSSQGPRCLILFILLSSILSVVRLYYANVSYMSTLGFPGTRGPFLPHLPCFMGRFYLGPGHNNNHSHVPYVPPVGWLYLTLLGLLNNACYVLYPFQLV